MRISEEIKYSKTIGNIQEQQIMRYRTFLLFIANLLNRKPVYRGFLEFWSIRLEIELLRFAVLKTKFNNKFCGTIHRQTDVLETKKFYF